VCQLNDTPQSTELSRVSFRLAQSKVPVTRSLAGSLTLFLPRAFWDMAEVLPSVREKALGKAFFAVTTIAV